MKNLQKKRRKRAIRNLRLRRIVLTVLITGLIVFLISKWEKQKTADNSRASLPPQDSSSSAAGAASVRCAELPAGWEQRHMPEGCLAQGTLVLVNRDYAYDPSLPETVSVYEHKTRSYLVRDTILSVREDTIIALNRWMDAFAAESGKTDVNVVAGWRSYEDQAYLYQNAVATKGQAHADAYLAQPGRSEHHTGLAVDLDTYHAEDGTSGGFDGDGAYSWAVEHAWEYGFVQRYPPQKREITGIDYESWHFRYVGLPHAYIMQTEKLCLEEYVEYLRRYPFSGEHLFVNCLGRSYELYYCPGDWVIVPTSRAYTISGNNVDGFVVVLSELSSQGRAGHD